MIYYKFSKELNQAFTQTLKSRVNQYFKEEKISKNGDNGLVYKSIIMVGIYLIPFLLQFIFSFPVWVLFVLWAIMGVGKSLIGTSVMHDSQHGSFTKDPAKQTILDIVTLTIGVSPLIWKLQHNVLHHTYTNIEHADEDISPRFLFRFSPYQPHRWFHKFQHIYAPLFYSMMTLLWVTFKDYAKMFRYYQYGLIRKDEIVRKSLGVFAGKMSYLAVFLLLPYLYLGLPFWLTLLLFTTMHLVSGLILSLIFQPAHVVPHSEYIETNEPVIEQNWQVHQLMTTSNYGIHQQWLTWLIGGLNHQVEHHLFPDICHIHYPALSKIVKTTTEEYGLPYFSFSTFRKAIFEHFKMLKMLGNPKKFALATR